MGAIDVTSPQAAAALLDARPDASVNLESLWEEEWRKHLAQAAIAKVKERVPPEQLQMFEFSVIDRWPVRKVADALGVSIAQVYMARHRVGKIIKKEIQRLEQHMI